MKPIRRLAIVINADKTGAPGLAKDLVEMVNANGVAVKKTTRFPLPSGFLKDVDACCVIGGDGTLLSVGPQAAEYGVPVMGVNRGSLGFLTTFSGEEAKLALPEILKGHYQIDERAMLDCSPIPKGPKTALNDVLIKDAVNSRLIRLDVYADGELVCGYTCDGLVFSTPTGSTAYNLSAGGPLIHPSVRVLAMTPICPHTLSNRAIIFRDDVKLRVYNRSKGAKLLISVDGQRSVQIESGSPVSIESSRRKLPLIQRLEYSHFAIVRTKLKWSGGFADLK